MSKLNAFLVASALTLLPASAMAEVSLADMLNVDTSLSLDSTLHLDMAQDIARGHHNPRANHHPAPPPPAAHHTTVHHTTVHHNTRARVVRPVVVVEQPSTVVVDTSSYSSDFDGSKLGFGIKGMGMVLSSVTLDNTYLQDEIGGGVGFYFKYRPIRWISPEFNVDFLYGTIDNTSQFTQYYKIPVSIGLRAHVLDYGMFDVYGVAAFAVNFLTIDDGDKTQSRDAQIYQLGGQIGAGASIITGAFEVGIDLRYTFDDRLSEEDGYRMVDETQHGFIFSLNLGFAL